MASLPDRAPQLTVPQLSELGQLLGSLKTLLSATGCVSGLNEQFDLLDKRAKETVLASVKFAEESPQPPLDKLYDYTYANGATS